ncbi:MAG: prolyl oligopeptidase family serine peptidase [Gammaproteobacteria bacterium]
MRSDPGLRRLLLACCALALLVACAPDEQGRGEGAQLVAEPGRYPAAARGDVADDYHGVRVQDPYRWLEDLEAPDTAAWVAAANAHSRPYLDGLPTREHFAARLAALVDYERFGVPERSGPRYVYTYNSGSQEQDSVWVTDDISRRGMALIDPDAMADDGTVSVSGFVLGPEGRHLAYGVSDGGSDWRTWRIRDADTGKDLAEELRGIKFSGVSWAPDGDGFYYSRYPRADDGAYDDQRQVSIWFHALGTPQSDDVEVYRVTDHPTRNPYATVTDDGRYLVIDLFDGYATNGVYYKTLTDGVAGNEVVRLLDAWDARYEFLGNDGATFFFKTVKDTPLGRVIAIDLARPTPDHWRTVVPEADYPIRAASLVGGRFFVQYMIDAQSAVRVFDLDGTRLPDVELPGQGSVGGFAGRRDDDETFYSYTDFTTPRSVYRYDIETGRSEPVSEPVVSVDTSRFTSRQVFATSRDGTRVPMFVVHRKDIDFAGSNPTVLYGYGGFNISILPSYSSMRMAWLDAGGVFVSATLRGGGEYGEDWYRAGTVLEKQNVFDDFIAAAEWLIDNDVTTPDTLAIWGVSNGGLLAAAVGLQRPELFAAVVPSVGVLDMLRYHTASANARQWSTDYGLSENADEFTAQHAYSPYHNLRAGDCYAPTLILADANDDRVLPWHSYKFGAALQHAQGCDNPVVMRIETRSGHGAGRSTSKNVEQYADQWAFVAARTGLKIDAQ